MEAPNQNDTGLQGLEPGFLAGAGRYTLVRSLDANPGSALWLATENQLGEHVALKFYSAALRTDSVFLDELRRAVLNNRKLSHPNIVRIFDLFDTPGEPVTLAMEHVEGSSLESMQPDVAMPLFKWDELKPLLSQALSALQYAHSENRPHGNLNLGNLLLDRKGRLKLASFALPWVPGEFEGKPNRFVCRCPQALDGRAPQTEDDVYSLGAIIYELLSGQPIFTEGDLEHQIRHTVPRPLEERLVECGVAHELPDHLFALVSACLSKDPAKRPRIGPDFEEWLQPKSFPPGAAVREPISLMPPAEPARVAAPSNPQAEAEAFEQALGTAAAQEEQAAGSALKWAIGLCAAALLTLAALWYSQPPAQRAGARSPTSQPAAAAVPLEPAETNQAPPAAAPASPVTAAKPVQLVSGTPDRSTGLDALVHGDGRFTVVEQAGQRYWLLPRRSHLYMGVDDSLRAGLGASVEIELEYRNTGAGDIRLHYDSQDLSWPDQGAYKEYPTFVQRMNTGQWRSVKFSIPDARFENRQNSGADLRFYNNGDPLLIRAVRIRRAASSGS